MDAPPRVSVIVRTKDRPGLLREALQSLRLQTFQDFEVVLVNEGAELLEAELLSPGPGRGLVVVKTEEPRGRARALNIGLRTARGRYVAYLDDDDMFLPDHLATLAGFLDGSHEYRAVYADVEQMEQVLQEDGKYHDSHKRHVYAQPFHSARLLFSNFVPIIGLMHHLSLAEEAGMVDESFDLFEDWDFLIRLSRLTRFHRIPRVTSVYRVRDDGTNATSEAGWMTERSQAARRQLFEKHWSSRTPDLEMEMVDSFQAEIGSLRDSVHQLLDSLESAKAAHRLAASHLENRTLELRALRADGARQVQESAERESALRAEIQTLSGLVTRMQTSRAWRLFTPYWKLKSLLKR